MPTAAPYVTETFHLQMAFEKDPREMTDEEFESATTLELDGALRDLREHIQEWLNTQRPETA